MKPVVYILIAALAGGAFGYYLAPAKVVTKEVTRQARSKKMDVVTVTIETVHPDGTITRRTERVDKSTILTERNSIIEKKQEPVSRDTLKVSALFAGDLKNNGLTYGVSVEKRVLGPVYLGVFGLASGMLGFSVGLSF